MKNVEDQNGKHSHCALNRDNEKKNVVRSKKNDETDKTKLSLK